MSETTITRTNRKVKQGTVVSNKMDKTVVVSVTRTVRHPVYDKVVKIRKRYYAHDESGSHNVGDHVTIMETKPISKLKRWRVVENVKA